MAQAYSKAERLLEIETLLLSHPDGLRQADIARRLGVNRSTVHRYLPELTSQFQVYEAPDGRLAIDREQYLARVRVNVHEAAAIFLAARLLDRQSDERNPHAASALEKLSIALDAVAPPMARGIADTAERMRLRPERASTPFMPVMEALTSGWVRGRFVEVRYRRLYADAESVSRIAPYVLEATGPGFSTYVLGLREPPGEVQVLKVERITAAVVTDDPFELPADLDVARVFENAWGIWRPDEDGPVEVVLRFSAAVAGRVRESRWHGTESTEPQPDGGLLWRARIGDATEIRPWIRGWGPEVEVLAPLDLRDTIAADCRAAWRRYAGDPALADSARG